MSLLDKLQMRSESIPENDPELTQDPEPGEKPARGRRSPTKAKATPAAPRKATPAVSRMAKEVAEDLASLLEGTAAVWGMSDQCCAPILEQQAKPIAEALTGILARNPRLLAKFADTDIVSYTLQAAALGRALLPVGKAVYANHVSKAVDDDQEAHRDGSVHLGQFPAFNGVPRTVPA